ncbi:MAG: hypothetical protein U9Q33_01890 [Campylobacterota bacterium]|nr:hypothetical protein [Campylobacterota bacterium]
MIKMINKALKVLLTVDAGVVAFCLLTGNTIWLINTQIAFFSSLMVTLGSYMGYRKNISSRVENHSSYDDGYDELDQMDDRYDLYSPEVPQEQIQEELTKEQIKEEIDKSKKSLKKNYIKNFIGGFSGMASLYRLAGYIGLIIGFFYLNNNGYLHILSYIFGFIIVPVCALILQFTMKNESSKF